MDSRPIIWFSVFGSLSGFSAGRLSQWAIGGSLTILLLAFVAGDAPAAFIELSSPHEETGGMFGTCVSSMPDIDGDGRGDVIIGAHGEDVGAVTDTGRSYIISGFDGTVLSTLVSPNAQERGGFGCSVSGVPDLNGDGRGDVIVGAAHESIEAGTPEAGRVYIFSGSDGTLLQTLVSPNEEAYGYFGVSVSGVPDLNGDGRGDVIVGAVRESIEAVTPEAGRVYIFSGSDGTVLQTLVSPNAQESGLFGSSVFGMSDVNGDGRCDVIVGAELEAPGDSPPYAGRAYVFSGSDGTVLHTLISPHESTHGRFGGCVSAIADLNGDGRDDIVVGAYMEASLSNGLMAGSAYIFSGSDGALLRRLSSPGEEDFGFFGNSVFGIPDADNDGWADVLVGAPFEEAGSSPGDAGRVHIFSGHEGTLIRTLASPHPEAQGSFGWDVCGVPDVNGDGSGDIVVGAYFENPGSSPNDAGRAYIFFGLPRIAVIAPAGSLDFGTQDVSSGPTTPRMVLIANEGESELNFIGAGFVISGSDTGEFLFSYTPDTSPVAPGDARAVFIAFDPSSVGEKSAFLRIASSDPDEPVVEIPLFGMGTTPTSTPTVTSTPTETPAPTFTPIPTNVKPSALLAFAPKAGGAPLEVELSGAGFDPDGELVQCYWYFTDWQVPDASWSVSSAIVENTTTHVYGVPGIYQVAFRVRDDEAAFKRATGEVVVWTPLPPPIPTATATASPTPRATPTLEPWQHCDVNGDGRVDHLDVIELQHWWQRPHP